MSLFGEPEDKVFCVACEKTYPRKDYPGHPCKVFRVEMFKDAASLARLFRGKGTQSRQVLKSRRGESGHGGKSRVG
jgi:hypothetical protein